MSTTKWTHLSRRSNAERELAGGKKVAIGLERPAAATLARGVELAARVALERTPDATGRQSLLERFNRLE